MAMYVVAGATGRVGSIVAGELLEHGARVRVIVRDPQRAIAWERRGAEVALGSLTDGEFLSGVLRGADGFFALLPEDPNAADFHGDRRRMVDAMVARVHDSGVSHVVLLSAVAAALADGNGPCKDLHYFENALRATPTRMTTLRPCWFQENVAMVIQPAVGAGVYPNFLPSADAVLPTIATRDVGRCAASVLLATPGESEIIDLVGPSYSVRQLADALGKAIGKTLQIVPVPSAGHVPALLQAGLSQSFAEAVAELYNCFAHRRITPQGNRIIAGTTTVEEVLVQLLAPPLAASS